MTLSLCVGYPLARGGFCCLWPKCPDGWLCSGEALAWCRSLVAAHGTVQPSCSFGFCPVHYTAPNPFSLSDITSPGSRPLKHVCLFPVPCPPHVTSKGSSFQMSPTSISFTPSLLLAHWEGGGGLIISCLDDPAASWLVSLPPASPCSHLSYMCCQINLP